MGAKEKVDENAISRNELEDCNIERDVNKVWYAKVKKILDQLVKISKKLRSLILCPCYWQNDEVIQREVSTDTPNQKQAEGFSICCTLTGFVYDSIPDRQLEKSTIAGNILALTESLLNRDTKLQ